MSVRAHRIIEIKIEEDYTSFNLYADQRLREFLDEQSDFMTRLNSDGNGISEVSVEVLENAVEQTSELELDSDTVEGLKKDIEWAKANNHEFVQYDCY